jgi:mRNA interferase RelE/StbE
MQIVVSSKAKKDLLQIDKETRKKISEEMQKLLNSPAGLNIKKLKGSGNTMRLRVGDYRVLYEQGKDIIIVRIKHRKDAYRNL